MTSGKSSVFSPAHAPIFDPSATRSPTRVRQQGGEVEFPFQWTWGALESTSRSVGIYSLRGHNCLWAYCTFITPPSNGEIGIGVFVNGVRETSTGFDGDGRRGLEGGWVPPNGVIHILIDDVASADASGMWLGLTISNPAIGP